MKTSLRYAALSCNVSVLALALSLPMARAQSPAADEQTFLTLQHQWAEARKSADLRFLERFYGSDFTVGNMNGGESSRAQDIAMFSSGDLKPTAIDDREMHVSIFGQTAMVTGVEHLEGSYRGRTGQFDLRFTNVFVYRDGRWQLVRHQAAQIRN